MASFGWNRYPILSSMLEFQRDTGMSLQMVRFDILWTGQSITIPEGMPVYIQDGTDFDYWTTGTLTDPQRTDTSVYTTNQPISLPILDISQNLDRLRTVYPKLTLSQLQLGLVFLGYTGYWYNGTFWLSSAVDKFSLERPCHQHRNICKF